MAYEHNPRCAGAMRVTELKDGKGEKLKFVNIPYCMCGAILNELAGLDDLHGHPLKGAVYFTENSEDTFDVTVFQNELEGDLVEIFLRWFMSGQYVKYADGETAEKFSSTYII